MPRIVFRNFTGGEVTPSIAMRYDLQKFGTFLQICENFIPNAHGDIERRPGMEYISTTEQDSYLFPFQFSSEPSENYALVFSKWDVRVYENSSGCLSSCMECQPYSTSHFCEITYAQVADVLYLAHRCYPLYKITRTLCNNSFCWEMNQVLFNVSICAPTNVRVCAVSGCSDYAACYCTSTLSYKVSAVDKCGIESVASSAATTTFRYPTDWYQGDHVEVSWAEVQGASEYNIYRDYGGFYGFIGTSTNVTFTDENYEPDVSITPRVNWWPFSGGNYPGSITFHQQRLALAGTNQAPSSFYMSRTGDFESFRKSYPLQDDDPIEYMVSSNSVDDIHWLASFGSLFIGTSGAEYSVDSPGDAITPSSVTIKTQSYWGSKSLPPLIIGSAILHEQRYGSHIREIVYNWEIDGYSGNDLSLLAPQLVEGHIIKQWAYQQSPWSNVWMVREDGILLCLTYIREQNIYAWSRHVTKGEVKSIITLCGETEDILWLIVKRTINGVDKYFLERLHTRLAEQESLADAFYLDCAVMQEVAESSDPDYTMEGLGHLEGEHVDVLNNGLFEKNLQVTNSQVVLQHSKSNKIVAGLPYTSVLATMPMETDIQSGTTVGKTRAFGDAMVHVRRTIGGSYAATKEDEGVGEIDLDSVKFYDLPFLPDTWDEPYKLFSGNIQVTIPSGQDRNTAIILKQDKPFPFRLLAISAEIIFGER